MKKKTKFDVAPHTKKIERHWKCMESFISFFLFYIVASLLSWPLKKLSKAFNLFMSFFFIIIVGLEIVHCIWTSPSIWFFFYFSKVAKIAHLCVYVYVLLSETLFPFHPFYDNDCMLAGWALCMSLFDKNDEDEKRNKQIIKKNCLLKIKAKYFSKYIFYSTLWKKRDERWKVNKKINSKNK